MGNTPDPRPVVRRSVLSLGTVALALLAVAIGGSLLLSWQVRERDRAAAGAHASTGNPAALSAPNPGTAEIAAACQNLYRAVCSKTGITRDPSGTVEPDLVGEIQALRIYREIATTHPDWTREQAEAELVQEIYTERRRQRIESAFRWVRQHLERIIDRQPEGTFTTRERRQIKARLRATELQLPPPASVYDDEPELLTKNDVYYERTLEGKTRMRVGGAYLLTVKSWFNLVFTVAHELAHSIDPCEIRSARLSFPAYDRIAGCFMKQGLVNLHRGRSECGENDQLSETFADWMAVQATADALKSFATEFHPVQIIHAATNAVRDLCEQNEDPQGDEIDTLLHPTPQVRIQRIFGDSPEIQKVLGCPVPTTPPPEYCDFNSRILEDPRKAIPPS